MTDELLLPKDVTDSLAQNMDRKYATHIGDRVFSIAAERDLGRVTVTVTLSNEKQSFYYPVEARVNYEMEEMKAAEAALFLIDYIDLYFEEFFQEDEALYVPIDWAKYSYDAVDFELRGQILNKMVEAMADKILAEDEGKSVLN